MGGYGSSRWGWRSKKTTVEECRNLDVTRWQREGIIAPDAQGAGGWTWRDAQTLETRASISYAVRTGADAGQVSLSYTVTPAQGDKVPVTETVPLVTTRPNFGGLRWWFLCPRCRRRVGKLYMAPGAVRFLCRVCHGLTYRSAQEHDKTADRYRRMDPETLATVLRGDQGPLAAAKAAIAVLEARLGRARW